MNAQSIRSRLRAIEPQRAETQTALIAALNRREIEDLRTVARVAGARDRQAAAAWIRFDTRAGPVVIAPLLVDNQLARMTSGPNQPDGAAAAATLGRIEALVAALETSLGLELHPAGLARAPEGEPLLLRLDARDAAGALRHRLLIGTPAGIPVAPLPLPDDLPPRLAGLALAWTAQVTLPPLPVARLAMLARGDMILMGIGRLSAQFALPGRNHRATMTIALDDGRATLDSDPDEGNAFVSDRTHRLDDPAGDAGGSQPAWSDLRVPSLIEFDGGGLTAAEMATLGKGSVLPLPVAGGTLAVRVIAGGALVADGELVAVGDGYGVLVTAVHPRDAG